MVSWLFWLIMTLAVAIFRGNFVQISVLLGLAVLLFGSGGM